MFYTLRPLVFATSALGMRAAAAFEALEDGSASPPHIGGALVQQLTH